MVHLEAQISYWVCAGTAPLSYGSGLGVSSRDGRNTCCRITSLLGPQEKLAAGNVNPRYSAILYQQAALNPRVISQMLLSWEHAQSHKQIFN